MKKLFFSIAVIIFAYSPAIMAQTPEEEYKEVMTKYMEVSGSDYTLVNLLDTILNSIGLPADQMDQFDDAFKKQWVERLYELMLPMYEQNLSIDDLREAIRFYETPAGVRMREAVPGVTAAAEQAGQQWTMEFMQALMEMVQ